MKAAEARNIAVIGAGLMGPGIALTFARGGFNVCLRDLTAEKVQRALDRIRADLALFVENETPGRGQVGARPRADPLAQGDVKLTAVILLWPWVIRGEPVRSLRSRLRVMSNK